MSLLLSVGLQDSKHTIKKLLDTSSGYFQLVHYTVPSSSVSTPPAPASAPPILTHSSTMLITLPNSDAPPAISSDLEFPALPISRQNSNSSDPASPNSPNSNFSDATTAHIIDQAAKDLAGCISAISAETAQCRSMLPILFVFVANGDVSDTLTIW